MENTKTTAALLSSCLLGIGLAAAPAWADDDDHDRHRVRASLSGYSEVHFVTTNTGPGTPLTSAAIRGAVSTNAQGSFRATIDKGANLIHYTLRYSGIEGGQVTQAHIHFGQAHTVGGIVVWLCQRPDLVPPFVDPAGKAPNCPPQEGTVKGTIAPDQVLAVAGQGIAAQELDELVRAIRAGATYANVHSQVFGPGEIRGQIGGRDD
jgi:hypothetical protein